MKDWMVSLSKYETSSLSDHIYYKVKISRKCGKHFIRPIYCQLSWACVLLKDLPKAKQFLSLAKVDKNKGFTEEEN